MKRILILAVMGNLVLASAAQAAVVYLKDGSQVRGTVVSATARDLQLHTPDGELTISTNRILRVDYSEKEPPATPPADSIPVKPVPVSPEPPIVRQQPYYHVPNEDSLQSFSLGLGLAAPLSRVDLASTGGGSEDNGNSGVLLGGRYLFNLNRRVGVGMDAEFFNRGRTNSQSLLPASNTDVFGNSLLLLATLKFSLVDHGYVRPYILGGIGTNRTSTVIEASPNPGFGWSDTNTAETRTLVDDSHWGLATTARFGIDFLTMDPNFFSLEFGWTGLSNPTYTATRSGQDLGLDSVTGNQNALVFAARWGWRF